MTTENIQSENVSIKFPTPSFSKLSKLEKINSIVETFFKGDGSYRKELKSYWHQDSEKQKIFDEFSENTISNFYLPFGVIPSAMIDGKEMAIPMVIEESSVVAAASKAAKFWSTRGGFKTEVISTVKSGQVHFIWDNKGHDSKVIFDYFKKIKPALLEDIAPLEANMKKRGGGVLSVELKDLTDLEPNYYQLDVRFETCNAMGANFINSVLEDLGRSLKNYAVNSEILPTNAREIEVVMAILSNYTPECVVKAWVECPVEDLEDSGHEMSAAKFAEKFVRAVRISKIDKGRATTHNKGIMNGIDAVVLATGNDFRAIEAGIHTYAARDGQYRGLSDAKIENGIFTFSLEIPLAVGTVGGLTALHPLSKLSLDLLGRPDASELMKIIATVGLAQNFGAVRSLVTSGIQKGHMKMHLLNILNYLEASENERELARTHFENEVISFSSVRDFLASIRNYKN